MKHNEKRPFQLHMVMMRAAAVLLVLVMLSTSMIVGRFARYTASDNDNGAARIAAFVFDVQEKENAYFDLSDIRKPGDRVTCEFTVRNHNGAVSEVEEQFILNMELRGSLPLKCTLSGGDNIELNGIDIDASGMTGAEGAIHTFEASVQEEIVYTLIVEWPEEENDVVYSRAGLAELLLTVSAQQVD